MTENEVDPFRGQPNNLRTQRNKKYWITKTSLRCSNLNPKEQGQKQQRKVRKKNLRRQ